MSREHIVDTRNLNRAKNNNNYVVFMFILEKIRYVSQQLGCSIYNALILIKFK